MHCRHGTWGICAGISVKCWSTVITPMGLGAGSGFVILKFEKRKMINQPREVHPSFTNLCYNARASFFDIKTLCFYQEKIPVID